MNALKCDMDAMCTEAVTHVDNKGFVYCTNHGEKRKRHYSCRKLKASEVIKLQAGETIKY